MNELDTYDTLKHGHIPVMNLLSYAKDAEKFNIDNFKNNGLGEYIYGHTFELVYDGDFYDISCYICEPNEEYDCVTVNFWADLHHDLEEKRKLPIFPDTCDMFIIKTREDFVSALNKWQYFVGEAYVKILRHRLEIIENLDSIIEAELKLKEFISTKQEMYKHYNHCFGHKLVNELILSVEKICEFC